MRDRYYMIGISQSLYNEGGDLDIYRCIKLSTINQYVKAGIKEANIQVIEIPVKWILSNKLDIDIVNIEVKNNKTVGLHGNLGNYKVIPRLKLKSETGRFIDLTKLVTIVYKRTYKERIYYGVVDYTGIFKEIGQYEIIDNLYNLTNVTVVNQEYLRGINHSILDITKNIKSDTNENSLDAHISKYKNWLRNRKIKAGILNITNNRSALEEISTRLEQAIPLYKVYCSERYKALNTERQNNPKLIGNKAFELEWDKQEIKRFNTFLLETLELKELYDVLNDHIQPTISIWEVTKEGHRILNKPFIIKYGILHTYVPPVIELGRIYQSEAGMYSSAGKLSIAPYLPEGLEVLDHTFYKSNIILGVKLPSTVKKLINTFEESTLKQAPKIPSSVIEMIATYKNCKNLSEPGEIPGNVKIAREVYEGTKIFTAPKLCEGILDITGIFKSSYIKQAPIIPSTVRYMADAFAFCSELENIPNIPNGVENINNICLNAIKMHGDVKLPDSIVTMNYAFSNTKINSNVALPSNLRFMTGAFDGTQVKFKSLSDKINISPYERANLLDI